MYCPKCGTLNPDGSKLCQRCSWVLRGENISTVAEYSDAKTSGAAKAALILGIISFFTFGITALPAFICGVIGLINIERSGGTLKGKGYAIFGIVLPVLYLILLFFVGILAAILLPTLGNVRGLSQRLICGTNMQVIGTAVMIYANDYDNKIPDGSNWCTLLEQKVDVSPKLFICPSADGDECSYAININAVGKDIDSLPADMVLVFESLPGCNQAGGAELLNTENHCDGCSILFCDGHVEFVKIEDFTSLLWDETQTPGAEDAQN